MHLIALIVKVPLPAGNKDHKFNIIGLALLCLIPICFVFGAGSLSLDMIPSWTGGILMILGIVFALVFYFYDKSDKCKVKAIPVEVLNPNTLNFLAAELMTCIGSMADTFF